MEGLQSGNHKELGQLISLAAPDVKTYCALQLTAKVFVVRRLEEVTIQNSIKRLTRSYLWMEPFVDVKHGLCKWYYNTGTLQKATYFYKGVKVISKTYHPCGKIEGVVYFDEQGLKHGSYLTWTDDGELDSITPYNHGVLDGVAVAWISNAPVRDRARTLVCALRPSQRTEAGQRPAQYIKSFKDGVLHGYCYDVLNYSVRHQRPRYQRILYYDGVALAADTLYAEQVLV